MNDSKRKSFLVLSPETDRLDVLGKWIENHYTKPTLYTAQNDRTAHNKLANAFIDVVVVENNHDKIDMISVVKLMLREKRNPNMSVIILGNPPELEVLVDELVLGQVQFLDGKASEEEFSLSLAKALNYGSLKIPTTFHLKFLAKGETLLNEGDKAEYIYILKNGEMHAYRMNGPLKTIIGTIGLGEFVGEMALINNEPRSASIEAVTDCELIEMPIGLVSQMIYTKPSWAKALMQALSKRLKDTNKMVTSKS